MNKTILIIAMVLVIIIGGYFLLRGSYQTPTLAPIETSLVAPAEVEKQVEIPPSAQIPVGTTEISVDGTEFSLSPKKINVKAGERVKITFRNSGRTPHNLVLEGLGVKTKTIGGGQTDVIEFAAPASGTYAFSCSVPGHKAAGMEGEMTVE